MRLGVFERVRPWIIAAYAFAAIVSAFAHLPVRAFSTAKVGSTIDLTAYTLPDGSAPGLCLIEPDASSDPDKAVRSSVCEACLFAACHLTPPEGVTLDPPPSVVLDNRPSATVDLATPATLARARARAPPASRLV